jgi:hypothetical protein
MRLAGVLDHHQAMLLGDLVYGVHVGGLAKEMHGHHRFGPRGERGLYCSRVDVGRVWEHIHKHRGAACVRDGFGSGHECVGGQDDLITRPDACGLVGQQ